MKIVEEFHAIEHDGKFWQNGDDDGRSTTYGWGSIQNANRVNPKFCKKPEDATWRGSYLVKELKKGRIVKVRMVTEYEILGHGE